MNIKLFVRDADFAFLKVSDDGVESLTADLKLVGWVASDNQLISVG